MARLTGSRWLPLLLSIYALNTAYLAASASPTIFYFANVVFHIAGGIALTAAWFWGRRAAGAAERSPRPSRLWKSAITLAYVVLGAGLAFGLLITILGAAGRWRWLLPVHIALSLAGGLPLRDRRSGVRSSSRCPARTCSRRRCLCRGRNRRGGRSSRCDAHLLARQGHARHSKPFRRPDQHGRGRARPVEPVLSVVGRHQRAPHDPVQLLHDQRQSCGRCHTDIYEQWKSSTHHFSSFNNQWYRKSIEYMQDTVGTKPSKWCAGCHDHAVFFNGRFDKPIKEQIDTPEAQAGLACTSCHSITNVHSTMGQGDFEIEYPPLHDLAASENPLLRFVHDRLTYIDPQPHKEIFLKPFHTKQTPEFCSSCHKVHLDVPVNSYRWFRGFNDYDNWQASGVSGEGARSFYYPKKSQKCADCHMPLVDSNDPAAKNGKVRRTDLPPRTPRCRSSTATRCS